jgi:8-oxo-dGTP diphosphatase
VDAIIMNQRSVLLIKRGNEPYKGRWALPGGYMNFDESGEEAVIREVKEETGLDTKDPLYVGVYTNPARSPVQNVGITYRLTPLHTNIQAGDDAVDIGWFEPNNLPVPLAFDHEQIIRDALIHS